MASTPAETRSVGAPGTLVSRVAAPLIVASVIGMLVVPLSPLAISFMFAVNISIGLVVLAAAIYIPEPAEFLSFPSVLLGTTLMRLALNVATARAIMLDGHNGTDAAGQIVEAFGRFVVGGNYAVGLLIFVILIVINMAVVTKGAGRVAEVSARFTLDSLPGRQMAIDADVNAGTLTAKQAEARRNQLRQEADFFGAMDGASKFVRGDAIAAVIILTINLVGGLMVGTLQYGLPIGIAAHTYTLLTVGDGVAAQIPSLTISMAAGLIVTRVATGEDISTQIVGQLSRYPQALMFAGGLMAALGLMPGMAHVPFLTFGAVMVGGAARLRAARRRAPAAPQAAETEKQSREPAAIDAAAVQRMDPFGLGVGFALVPLLNDVGPGKPTLLARLTAVRQQYSRRLGFVAPNIHVRDAEGIRPQEYRFTIRDATVGRGEVVTNAMLAIETRDVVEKLQKGRRVKDPVYGQEAVWIAPERAQEAETLGYTVADPSGVIATHLGFILERYGWELLGRAETDELVGQLAKSHPKLVDDLRNRVQPGAIRQVLQALLAEGIPIRDFERIAEAIVDAPDAAVKDPERLLAHVRLNLGRQIASRFLGNDQVLRVLVLDPQLEALIHKAANAARDQGFEHIIEPNTARLLRAAAVRGKDAAEQRKVKPVLVVQGTIRRPVARCLGEIIPVIAAEEIPEFMSVLVIDAVRPPPTDQPREEQVGDVVDAA